MFSCAAPVHNGCPRGLAQGSRGSLRRGPVRQPISEDESHAIDLPMTARRRPADAGVGRFATALAQHQRKSEPNNSAACVA